MQCGKEWHIVFGGQLSRFWEFLEEVAEEEVGRGGGI